MAIAVDSWKDSKKVDRATPTESIVPTFGAVSKSTGRGGQFTIPSRRVYSEKVNGKLVEVFTVRENDKRSGRLLGFITRIDSRISQYVEYIGSGNKSVPSRIRLVQLGADGTVVSQVESDLTNVSLSSRVSVIDQPELRKGFHRILRGVANMVLPDVLHAQAVEDNPCEGWEMTFYGVVAAAATTASANAIAAAFCVTTLITCEAYLVTAAAAAAAALLVLAIDYKYNNCLSIHPYCFDGGYMTNGSCEPANGGGGTQYGIGYGGGGESSGIVSSTTGTIQGGISCTITTDWWIDSNGYHTNTATSCYSI